MIRRSVSSTRRKSFSSDAWHVVHARWAGSDDRPDRFERTLVSEHEARSSAYAAARAFADALEPAMLSRPPLEHDQVFVREPGCWSLEIGTRRAPRRRARPA